MSRITIRDQTGRQFSMTPGHPLEQAMLQSCRAYGQETTQIVFEALFKARSTYEKLSAMRRSYGDYMDVNVEILFTLSATEFTSAKMQELLVRVKDTAARL